MAASTRNRVYSIRCAIAPIGSYRPHSRRMGCGSSSANRCNVIIAHTVITGQRFTGCFNDCPKTSDKVERLWRISHQSTSVIVPATTHHPIAPACRFLIETSVPPRPGSGRTQGAHLHCIPLNPALYKGWNLRRRAAGMLYGKERPGCSGHSQESHVLSYLNLA